jgi:endonuclease YncB( thermonuclease family)
VQKTALLAVLLVLGCATEPTTTPGIETDTGTSIDQDSTAVTDSVAVTDSTMIMDAPLADSGCPAPATIAPKDLPAGYLPAERVNLNYTVDGDTAHFYFLSGEHIVRFLYVNTEETSGAEATAFGTVSKKAVDDWLRGAKEIMVAPRQGKTAGTPDLDPYMRWLALVFVDGELLQTRIIRQGYSAYYTQFGCAPAPLHAAFVNAEAEANANDRGIWAAGHPTDYRKVLADWMGTSKCRPNPYTGPYCM